MRFTLALLTVSAVFLQAVAIPVASPQTRSGFTFLGSVKLGEIGGKYQESEYWESNYYTGYDQAKRDCERFGDALLYLETQEEIDNVTVLVQNSNSKAFFYWVGGKYDVSSASFKWENGIPITSKAPWEAGEPSMRSGNTRVFAMILEKSKAKLLTEYSTTAIRYICESRRVTNIIEETKASAPCYNDNDLVIVVDSSLSITETDYALAKEFTSRLASSWMDHPGSRVSVIIYSKLPEILFGLKDSQSINIKEKVNGMRHIQDETNSQHGIDSAIKEIQNNGRNSIKNIVVLTDGKSWDRKRTKALADKANGLGIRTFSVGIGSKVNQNELLDIAGGKAGHVLSDKQFDQLWALLRPIV